MQPVLISITTNKIKKGKPDKKSMEAQVINFGKLKIFALNPTRRDLNKNQRFNAHIGCLIDYEGQTYIATRIDETAEPVHQLIHAIPIGA